MPVLGAIVGVLAGVLAAAQILDRGVHAPNVLRMRERVARAQILRHDADRERLGRARVQHACRARPRRPAAPAARREARARRRGDAAREQGHAVRAGAVDRLRHGARDGEGEPRAQRLRRPLPLDAVLVRAQRRRWSSSVPARGCACGARRPYGSSSRAAGRAQVVPDVSGSRRRGCEAGARGEAPALRDRLPAHRRRRSPDQVLAQKPAAGRDGLRGHARLDRRRAEGALDEGLRRSPGRMRTRAFRSPFRRSGASATGSTGATSSVRTTELAWTRDGDLFSDGSFVADTDRCDAGARRVRRRRDVPPERAPVLVRRRRGTSRSTRCSKAASGAHADVVDAKRRMRPASIAACSSDSFVSARSANRNGPRSSRRRSSRASRSGTSIRRRVQTVLLRPGRGSSSASLLPIRATRRGGAEPARVVLGCAQALERPLRRLRVELFPRPLDDDDRAAAREHVGHPFDHVRGLGHVMERGAGDDGVDFARELGVLELRSHVTRLVGRLRVDAERVVPLVTEERNEPAARPAAEVDHACGRSRQMLANPRPDCVEPLVAGGQSQRPFKRSAPCRSFSASSRCASLSSPTTSAASSRSRTSRSVG